MHSVRKALAAEIVIGALSAVIGAVTLIWPSWIETVFGLDPDAGSGALEWSLAVVCALVSAIAVIAARFTLISAHRRA